MNFKAIIFIFIFIFYFLVNNNLFAFEVDHCKKYGEEGKKYFKCAEFPIERIFKEKYKNEIFVNSIQGRGEDEIVILAKHLLDAGMCRTYSNSIFTYSKKLKNFKKKFNADSKIIELAGMSNSITILKTMDVKGYCQDTPGFDEISLRESILNKKSQWIVQSTSFNTLYYFDEEFNLLEDFFSIGLGYENKSFSA
jgi:hypothetical protein